ncbi:MAG: Outer rane beta-barrel protein [Acidobacteriota bacterium]|nr:Outer rane beta-barrel protein [Acidobacteriota bacterium]
MRCERHGLCLAFIVIGLCLFPVLRNLTYGEEKVSMPVRPFAINPENKFMRFDGIFNTGTDKDVEAIEHIIGVFLKNESEKSISNVTATASFDPDSGVETIPGYDTYEYKVLEPGIPELGFFRAKEFYSSLGFA